PISDAMNFRSLRSLFLILFLPTTAPAQTVIWKLDNLANIGGHTITVAGNPKIVEKDSGKAVEFNGTTDGLLLDVNPLAGLERFTVEIEFQPAAEGPEEQRFVHFQEATTENRAVVELRTLPNASWCLDSYLRYESAALTLIDRTAAHPVSRWHV